jgi:hypothetical protein
MKVPQAPRSLRERALFEGYGLQPVHSPPNLRGALAPEGTSSARLSSPQRLKPGHLDCQMDGLKAVPFKSECSRRLFRP